MKVGVLSSSGKDSWYAAYLLSKGNALVCVVSLLSENPESYMFHTPNVKLVRLQSKAAGLPLVEERTEGEKERELEDLKKAVERARDEWGAEGVSVGALASNYQKKRVERICGEAGVEMLAPLWGINQEEEMRELLKEGFVVVLSSIHAQGLDKGWLGRELDEGDVDRLVELKKRFGINVAGEGGEFESLVLDCPLFEKRLEIVESEVVEESRESARLEVRKARLVTKAGGRT